MKFESKQSGLNRTSIFTSPGFRQRKSASWFVLVIALAFVTQLAHGQALTTLYSFSGANGAEPQAGVVRDAAGNLYGTTYFGGGSCDCGTVFKLTAAGKLEVLHRFTYWPDGSLPTAPLIRDAAGNLYGTAALGGDFNVCAGNCGTVFKVDAAGRFTVLYSFTGAPDGEIPSYGGLIRDANGNLYGMTELGGDTSCTDGLGCGTVFKLDASNHETVLYRFTATGAEGNTPVGGLVRDAAGNLFGSTSAGGDPTCLCGTVFKLDTAGSLTVIHSFTGAPDGNNPATSLLQLGSNLYGTTEGGGSGSGLWGTVFELDKSGNETVVHSFAGGAADGEQPFAALISDAAGNLYGTTEAGGPSNSGVVFRLDKTGKETVLHNFNRSEGWQPEGALTRDAAGNLYGTTFNGGDHRNGTIFKLTP
jgi:uncharacterized repeat protein (TIGR03803 family)